MAVHCPLSELHGVSRDEGFIFFCEDRECPVESFNTGKCDPLKPYLCALGGEAFGLRAELANHACRAAGCLPCGGGARQGH